MSFEWPEHKVDLDEAARLITAAGKPVSRSSVSRFVKSRNFAVELNGQRKLVDAKALFSAYTGDFTRQVMAGETGSAPKIPAPAPQKALDRADPKFRIAEINATEAELDLARRLEQTVPAAEVAAGAAEAMAVLRNKLAEARADAAARLIQVLNLPEHAKRTITEELKRSDREAQEEFATVWAKMLTPEGQSEASARDVLDQLVALALELRGEAEPAPSEHVSEGASAPSESSGEG